MARYVSIWFPRLVTDWFALRQPVLRDRPFVLATVVNGKKIVTDANLPAAKHGITAGMAAADARALASGLEVLDQIPAKDLQLLNAIGKWCIRFSPVVAVQGVEGLIIDASGCTHLWGGEDAYVRAIKTRLSEKGYCVRVAMAPTIGCAWAMARFGHKKNIVAQGEQIEALAPLPPNALRIEPDTAARLLRLGLRSIGQFMNMPRQSLRRRFGQALLDRLDQGLGMLDEAIIALQPVEAYQERLPCLEPIVTAVGIEIALNRLLETLCARLIKEEKGLRKCVLTCHRLDNGAGTVTIGTNHPSHNIQHLLKLFSVHIERIEPGLGIELFVLDAPLVAPMPQGQESFWGRSTGDRPVAELLDRIACRLGPQRIKRYLPEEQHWPERSFRAATSLVEKATTTWQLPGPRPIRLLASPESVEVMAAVPDHPPRIFRYRGQQYTVARAEGPERIERSWWMDQGDFRDYYSVEDAAGRRYWLFRSGHYEEGKGQWFIHGFFA